MSHYSLLEKQKFLESIEKEEHELLSLLGDLRTDINIINATCCGNDMLVSVIDISQKIQRHACNIISESLGFIAEDELS